MSQQIQIRRGTTAEWTAANPTLAYGEFGVEKTVTNARKVKIGDGVTAWSTLGYIEGTGGGVTDHGDLTGLTDDDHAAYHTDGRGDTRYYQKTEFKASTAGATDAGKPVKLNESGVLDSTMYTQGDTDHGNLDGLSDDDHSQYHNDTRGDTRYYQKTEFKASTAGETDAGKPVKLNASGVLDSTMYTQGDTDHGNLDGLSDDDHSQYHNDSRGDARYFQETEHISSSSGESDAGKPIKTGSDGKLGESLLSVTQLTLANEPTSDHVGKGIFVTATAGETLAQNDLVYMKSDGKVWKAKGDAATTIPCIGMITTGGNADASVTILLNGTFRDDSWTWTAGQILYVSAATAGLLTSTAPSTTGNQVQIVGVALTDDCIFIRPDFTYVEVA